LLPLPAGSRLDPATGVFTWSPGVGFIGTYDLLFVRLMRGLPVARRLVRIQLEPKSSGHVGTQVVIDTPGDGAQEDQGFELAGWAADLDAPAGSGITAVHVWAYPAAGGAPRFVGAATYGFARPDVAALHGERFGESGYALAIEGLGPGTWDLAVFAWSEAAADFLPARVVRVTIR